MWRRCSNAVTIMSPVVHVTTVTTVPQLLEDLVHSLGSFLNRRARPPVLSPDFFRSSPRSLPMSRTLQSRRASSARFAPRSRVSCSASPQARPQVKLPGRLPVHCDEDELVTSRSHLHRPCRDSRAGSDDRHRLQRTTREEQENLQKHVHVLEEKRVRLKGTAKLHLPLPLLSLCVSLLFAGSLRVAQDRRSGSLLLRSCSPTAPLPAPPRHCLPAPLLLHPAPLLLRPPLSLLPCSPPHPLPPPPPSLQSSKQAASRRPQAAVL